MAEDRTLEVLEEQGDYRLVLEWDDHVDHPTADTGSDHNWTVMVAEPGMVDFAPQEQINSLLTSEMFRDGLAFFVDRYEHSGSVYSLSGEGPQCQFDTSRRYGVVAWLGPVENLGPQTPEDRAEDARSYLRIYTDWANGEGLTYVIYGPGDEVLDSCGGFYASDRDFAIESAREAWRDLMADVEQEDAERLEAQRQYLAVTNPS